jgi:hypothetical protein
MRLERCLIRALMRAWLPDQPAKAMFKLRMRIRL